MIQIDGSHGEGGGQIVRTSLALAMLRGEPITISNLRAKRKNPGLARQHLVAVRAAAELCQAEVAGDAIGSSRLVFKPGTVRSGDYRFAIGSAGSCTLVLQTILPPLLVASGPSTLVLEGGTHNPMAPPYESFAHSFLPQGNRMGPIVNAKLERHGFFPNGGGRIVVSIQPAASLVGFDLLSRGGFQRRSVTAVVSRLPRSIGERECQTIAQQTDWPPHWFRTVEVNDSPGPGNVVLIELQTAEVTEVFVGFGQRGVRAEVVAERAWDEAISYVDSGAPVGPHLADQLILPLAISAWHGGGGGSFRTNEVTGHTETHLELVAKLLEVETAIEQHDDGTTTVRIAPPQS